jgi:hypothetical protein
MKQLMTVAIGLGERKEPEAFKCSEFTWYIYIQCHALPEVSKPEDV